MMVAVDSRLPQLRHRFQVLVLCRNDNDYCRQACQKGTTNTQAPKFSR